MSNNTNEQVKMREMFQVRPEDISVAKEIGFSVHARGDVKRPGKDVWLWTLLRAGYFDRRFSETEFSSEHDAWRDAVRELACIHVHPGDVSLIQWRRERDIEAGNLPETPELTAETLQVDDRVNLESCPFLKEHAAAGHEYAVVASVERETGECVAVEYGDFGVVGYPPKLKLQVSPETFEKRKLPETDLANALAGIGQGFVATQSGGRLALGLPNDHGGISTAHFREEQGNDKIQRLKAAGIEAKLSPTGSPGTFAVVFSAPERKLPQVSETDIAEAKAAGFQVHLGTAEDSPDLLGRWWWRFSQPEVKVSLAEFGSEAAAWADAVDFLRRNPSLKGKLPAAQYSRVDRVRAAQKAVMVHAEALGIEQDEATLVDELVTSLRQFSVGENFSHVPMNVPNCKVMLTLRSACGCVGQGILAADQPLTWDVAPDSETVQAIFSRIDVDTLRVVEVVEMDGDDWREFEDSNAEASLVANVANGHSLETALGGVPASTCAPSPGM